MDTRERILAALWGEEPDKIPLTVYEMLFPRGFQERRVREAGVGLVYRLPAHTEGYRSIEVSTRTRTREGERLTQHTIHTPVGDVSQTLAPDRSDYRSSEWIVEHYIKKPEDYRVMEYALRDPLYREDYAVIRETSRRVGGDGLVYVRVAKAPIQEMLYRMMGMERFSIDYHHRRDLFDSLHATMVERYRELYDLAAGAPVEIILLGDNISSDVVGRERYRDYLMPEYEALSAALGGTGKRLAVHMDGRIASLAADIAESRLDVVEALTPSPMGDFSVADARAAWPGKALWINFTSSMHVASDDRIEAHLRDLVEQAGTKRGFAVGVTEDAPIEDLERSLAVMSRVLNDY